jgi:SP family myo-inositol transporter-like MFS transporter 13
MTKTNYNRLLILVAGLGGLLYGIDVGIIAGALPYLEATSGLSGNQLSVVVAAVLLGSVISTLFAGLLADWLGRKLMMALSGVLFIVSIPIIALSDGYWALVLGRLLQGISAGLIGVIVPLYLAECLGASSRGKGTGIFQWMLTLGIVGAAVIGYSFSLQVEAIAKLNDPAKLFAFKDTAWRSIFWVSLPPGIFYVICALMVSDSPRWLFRTGRKEAALAALLRSRTAEQAEIELREMEEAAEKARVDSAGTKIKDASQICHPVRAGLPHPGLQSGDGCQLHHRLQCHDPYAGGFAGFECAPRVCHSHARQFPRYHGQRGPGG